MASTSVTRPSNFFMLTIAVAIFFSFGRPWGFFGHKKINELAVYTLPPDMMRFYKSHINFIIENSVSADKRRYVVQEEAPKHYIDLDLFDLGLDSIPTYWYEAVETYSEDSLMARGTVPWHISLVKYQLTEAFRIKDVNRILYLSADLGHYIGDANVPLHTTSNYNGHLTDQKGIHGFWETRLPELFFEDYDFFVGRANYVLNPQERAWDAVLLANAAVDSVLSFERTLTSNTAEDKKFSFETRGASTIRTYSKRFSTRYHYILNGMVERQMRASVKMIGDFWYTCWVDAGQPNLDELIHMEFDDTELDSIRQHHEKLKSLDTLNARPHEY